MACYERRLLDLADVERTEKGKVYPAGTIYIQVSACSHNGSERFHFLHEPGELESKFAVILPKVPCIPIYLRMALERAAEDFFQKYVGTNINIQMSAFEFFRLSYDSNLSNQIKVATYLIGLEEAIQQEEQAIEHCKKMKEFMLANMFC